VYSLVLRRPFFARFLQPCIVFPLESMALDEEDCEEEGDAAAWDHKVENVTNSMSCRSTRVLLLLVGEGKGGYDGWRGYAAFALGEGGAYYKQV
jgi:hypothetical protein